MFDPNVLDPTVDLLVELARGGPALEFAVGTGRVALPLSRRGIRVSGIELSPHVTAKLREKPGADEVSVTIGDMTSTRVPGRFKLVYVVWNSINNVTTQDEQVAVFANAATHLEPGGCFLVETGVTKPYFLQPPEPGSVFSMEVKHVGIDTVDDLLEQLMTSYHWTEVNGHMVRWSAPFRYIWPSEIVLMGRLAGLRLTQRWAGWKKEPFTAESTNQIAVFEKSA